jgi:hypothetical protein
MQLVGRENQESSLLDIGGWCESIIDFDHMPQAMTAEAS